MKADITKADVHQAIRKLRTDGKKTTIEALRTELGRVVGRDKRGGPNTVRDYRDEFFELEQKQGAADVGKELEFAEFDKVWQKAYINGRADSEVKYQELEDDFAGEVAEVERLGLELLAANRRITDLESERDGALCKYGRATEELAIARGGNERAQAKWAAALERHADELNALRAAHAQELGKLRERLDQTEKTSHEAMIALARGEAEMNALRQRVEEGDRHHAEIVALLTTKLDAEHNRVDNATSSLCQQARKGEAPQEAKSGGIAAGRKRD